MQLLNQLSIRKKVSFVLAAILILGVIGYLVFQKITADITPQKAIISGTLKALSGRPIEGKIFLTTAEEKSFIADSDEEGNFFFAELPYNDYIFSIIDRDGRSYQPDQSEINLISIHKPFLKMVLDDLVPLETDESSATTTTTTTTVAPPVGTVDPSRGTIPIGRKTVWTVTYQDPSTNIGRGYLLINKELTSANGVFVYYNQTDNKIYLYENGQWTKNGRLGEKITLSNSLADIDLSSARVYKHAKILIVRLPITFKSTFSGNRKIWLRTLNKDGATASQWQEAGEVIVK